MKRFLDLADFGRDEVLSLLELARRLEKQPEPHALTGRILGLVFFNPSLRTLASFQAAMARLGGNSFVINPGQGSWQLETRPGVVMDGAAAEHVREGIPALAGYCDALGIRAFAEGKDLASDLAETRFSAMASLIDKPLLNLESAVNHPCQALADWKTLDDLAVPRAGRFVLSWAYHPRALPLAVPAAALHMAALRGMEVIVLRPEGFALPAAIMERARRAAAASGGSVRETAERDDALSGAEVVYAAGRPAVLRAVAALCRTRKIPAQVAVEERMGCGYGLCGTCAVPVALKDGSGWDHARACVDGPVFNPARVLWDRWPAAAASANADIVRVDDQP